MPICCPTANVRAMRSSSSDLLAVGIEVFEEQRARLLVRGSFLPVALVRNARCPADALLCGCRPAPKALAQHR